MDRQQLDGKQKKMKDGGTGDMNPRKENDRGGGGCK